MFPTEFTEQELTDWLNTLNMETSCAILEKLYKDMRDYAFGLHHAQISQNTEGQ